MDKSGRVKVIKEKIALLDAEKEHLHNSLRNRKKITMSTKSKIYKNSSKKIYIRTFGWPYVQVQMDGFGAVKETK